MVKDELRGRTRVGDDDIEYSVRARDIEELHRLQTSSTTNLEGRCLGGGRFAYTPPASHHTHTQTMFYKHNCCPSVSHSVIPSASMSLLALDNIGAFFHVMVVHVQRSSATHI